MRTIAALFLSLTLSAPAMASVGEKEVAAAYVQHAQAQYQASLSGLLEFQNRLNTFLSAPNAMTFRLLKEQWVSMRKPYSATEVFRFYGGPIDGEGGPEGRVNAWPLDEAYLDYVVGGAGSGIINDGARYPELTKDLISGLNEQGGEKNVTLGYHAIEFLLWGQDLSSSGPGNRPFTDFVAGRGKNAERRRQFLSLTTEMLIDDMRWIVAQWNVSDASSYAAAFLRSDTREALGKMLTGVFRLAGEELSQERMFVAYDTQSQEDEHSCFSDTTHFDIRFNYEGIKAVLAGVNGPGILTLLLEKDAALANEIAAKLTELDASIPAIPVPFDNAIFSPTGREVILRSVHLLEDLAKLTQRAGEVLGAEIQ